VLPVRYPASCRWSSVKASGAVQIDRPKKLIWTSLSFPAAWQMRNDLPSGSELLLLADPVEPLSVFRSPQSLLGLAVIGLTTKHLVVLPDRVFVATPISIGFSQAEIVRYQAGDRALMTPWPRLRNSIRRRRAWIVGSCCSNCRPRRHTGGLGLRWRRRGGRTGAWRWRDRRPACNGGRIRDYCGVLYCW
jgi:hypothetical protein